VRTVSDKIVSLRGGPLNIPTPEINQDLVDSVKKLLEQAESGEVTGIACTLAHGDETVSWVIVGSIISYRALGASYAVMDEVKTRLLEDEDDD